MARQTPLPRFRLDTDSVAEDRAASPSVNSQRSQTRIRRSACSDLQNSTIPEERICHDTRRRASLFVGRSLQPKTANEKPPAAEGDYIKLCRQRCQSLYKSLANKTSKANEQEAKGEDEEEEEIHSPPPSASRRNYRYSLPDASPRCVSVEEHSQT